MILVEVFFDFLFVWDMLVFFDLFLSFKYFGMVKLVIWWREEKRNEKEKELRIKKRKKIEKELFMEGI